MGLKIEPVLPTLRQYVREISSLPNLSAFILHNLPNIALKNFVLIISLCAMALVQLNSSSLLIILEGKKNPFYLIKDNFAQNLTTLLAINDIFSHRRLMLKGLSGV